MLIPTQKKEQCRVQPQRRRARPGAVVVCIGKACWSRFSSLPACQGIQVITYTIPRPKVALGLGVTGGGPACSPGRGPKVNSQLAAVRLRPAPGCYWTSPEYSVSQPPALATFRLGDSASRFRVRFKSRRAAMSPRRCCHHDWCHMCQDSAPRTYQI